MLLDYLGGLVTMGFLVLALFFLRFWRRTRDRLFMAFALAFALFAINQTVVALGLYPGEGQSAVYLLRLAGNFLIIAAIVAKNLGKGGGPRPRP